MIADLDRLFAKFTVGDECWLWHASFTKDGYGNVQWNGRVRRAHRVVYELLVGPIPKGLVIDHLCRVRNCVRPDHLEPVTQRENCRRAVGMGQANSFKTECKFGHPYDEANTYITPTTGSRQCRTCRLARNERRRQPTAPGA